MAGLTNDVMSRNSRKLPMREGSTSFWPRSAWIVGGAALLLACSPEIATPCPPGDGSVGCVAPCLEASENLAFLDGTADDPIHPGRATFTGGTWIAGADAHTIHVARNYPRVNPQFALYAEHDVIEPRVYDYSVVSESTPQWIEVDRGERTGFCSLVSGRIEIHELEPVRVPDPSSAAVRRLTVSFEQICNLPPQQAGQKSTLRGCIHYQKEPE
jgi:hypothetical protein